MRAAFGRLREKIADIGRRMSRPNPRPGVWNRYPRLAHYAHEGMPIALIVIIASNWLPKSHSAWQDVATFIGSTVWMVLMLGGLYHSHFLCERCIGKFPLDGPAMASRRKKQLYSAHFRVKLLYAAIIAYFLASFFGERAGLSRFWDNVLITITMAPQPYWFGRIFAAHSKLQPWCEHCGHGGGGSETEKVPDPSPSELAPA